MLGVRFLQSGTQITLEPGQAGEKTPVLNLDLKLQLSVANLLEAASLQKALFLPCPEFLQPNVKTTIDYIKRIKAIV